MAIAWCCVCGGAVIGGCRPAVADPVPCPGCGRTASLAALKKAAEEPLYGAYDYREEINSMRAPNLENHA